MLSRPAFFCFKKIMELVNATFIKGATSPEHFPQSELPEVAMIGRSNVGKSSLINQIVRHNGLARVSNTPGKTQEINFFSTDSGFVLVDLPGYGYAKVSKTQREQFSTLIRSYLLHREQMVMACVLVDARHDPMELDMAMIEELEFANRPFAVILTKCDKLKPRQAQARKEQFTALLAQCRNVIDVVTTSAHTGDGRSELVGMIKRIRTLNTKANT